MTIFLIALAFVAGGLIGLKAGRTSRDAAIDNAGRYSTPLEAGGERYAVQPWGAYQRMKSRYIDAVNGDAPEPDQAEAFDA